LIDEVSIIGKQCDEAREKGGRGGQSSKMTLVVWGGKEGVRDN